MTKFVEKLEDQQSIKSIKDNISLFLKPYIELDKRFIDDKVAFQIAELCEYLSIAESKEELDLYADTLNSILIIINKHYRFFDIEEYKKILLELMNRFCTDKINYENLKEEFFSDINFFIHNTEKFFRSYNKSDFYIKKINELATLYNQISADFQQIENLPSSNKKNQKIASFKKRLGNSPLIPKTSTTELKDQAKHLEICQKSIDAYREKRSSELKAFDNIEIRTVCMEAAGLGLTVATSAPIGSTMGDLAMSVADGMITRNELFQKPSLHRAISFGCSVLGIICLILPFPGSQIIGGVLLAKTLFDLVNRGFIWGRKTKRSYDAQKRVEERVKKTEKTFYGIEKTFYGIFDNAKKSNSATPSQKVVSEPTAVPKKSI